MMLVIDVHLTNDAVALAEATPDTIFAILVVLPEPPVAVQQHLG